MRRLACLLALAAQPGLAEIRYTPVTVPEHVYDGGWEHFVGGGVAVFDCDNDGDPDMVAAGGSNPMTLFRNAGQPDIAFAAETFDITGTTGAYPVDLNGDDVLDLVILRVGPDIVLAGDGACGFAPMDLPGLVFDDQWSTAFSATWEVGQDLPTLAFGHYVDRADPDGPFEACDHNMLWRPDGATYRAMRLEPGFCTLSALFTDWARTGRADLRLSNDRHYYVTGGAEQLWAMDGAPRLYTQADGWQSHELWGMGIATRDLDRDGDDEVFLSSMGDQRLMERAGPGPLYRDVPFERGTTAHRPYQGDDGRPSTGWHIAFGDVQNDGRDDVFIAKGNVQQMPGNAMEDPNNLLIQKADGRFVEAGGEAGVASVHRGRGAALEDFNGDGLLDLVVVNRRAALEVWQNTSTGTGNWIALDLRMDGPNTRAVGAWIAVDDGTSTQMREITLGGGHAGGVAGAQHFGLGMATDMRIRVLWPHGRWSDWSGVDVNQRLTIRPAGAGLDLRPLP